MVMFFARKSNNHTYALLLQLIHSFDHQLVVFVNPKLIRAIKVSFRQLITTEYFSLIIRKHRRLECRKLYNMLIGQRLRVKMLKIMLRSMATENNMLIVIKIIAMLLLTRSQLCLTEKFRKALILKVRNPAHRLLKLTINRVRKYDIKTNFLLFESWHEPRQQTRLSGNTAISTADQLWPNPVQARIPRGILDKFERFFRMTDNPDVRPAFRIN
ncbi:hypothetical protein D9M71_387710 [compost metagenome]